MPIKDIVSIVDLKGEQAAGRLAADLAVRLDAHVAGFAPVIEPVATSYMAGPMPANIIESARERAREEADTALAAFAEIARRAGARNEQARFTLVDGSAPTLVTRARLSDLILVGQERREAELVEPARAALIEAMLFETGVPVLVVPYIFRGEFALDHVTIAWDGGRMAARAVHAALPLLELAGKVSVFVIGDGRGRDEEPGADVATYLSRHRLEVEIVHGAAPDGDVAAGILNHASDYDVDMVVMGGYGHSRFREFVLGGVTRHMLEEMTVPTLMAH